jgi:hypothetical protein
MPPDFHWRQLGVESERATSGSKLEQVHPAADLHSVFHLRQKCLRRKWQSRYTARIVLVWLSNKKIICLRDFKSANRIIARITDNGEIQQQDDLSANGMLVIHVNKELVNLFEGKDSYMSEHLNAGLFWYLNGLFQLVPGILITEHL